MMEKNTTKKGSVPRECICKHYTEPHYNVRDNPVKVGYDWYCQVHGQQHREWDIAEYEAHSVPPPAGSEWRTMLRDNAWTFTTGTVFRDYLDLDKLESFIDILITEAEQRGAANSNNSYKLEPAQERADEVEWTEGKPAQVGGEKRCEAEDMAFLSNPPQYRCKNCAQFWFCKDPSPICKQPQEKKCTCATKHCEHYQSDFDRFIKPSVKEVPSKSCDCIEDYTEIKKYTVVCPDHGIQHRAAVMIDILNENTTL